MLAPSSYKNVSQFINRSGRFKYSNTPEGLKLIDSFVGLRVLRFANNVIFLGKLVGLSYTERKLRALGFGGNRIYIYLLRSGRKLSLNMYCVEAWSQAFELHYGALLHRDLSYLHSLGAFIGIKNDKIVISEGWTIDNSGNFFKDGVLCNGD